MEQSVYMLNICMKIFQAWEELGKNYIRQAKYIWSPKLTSKPKSPGLRDELRKGKSLLE